MATSRKRRNGMMGVVFALVGLIFWISGNTSIGIVFVALGVVFFAAGAARARKPDQGGTDAPPPGGR